MSMLSDTIWKESTSKDDSKNFNLKFEKLKKQICEKKMKKCLNLLQNAENPLNKNKKIEVQNSSIMPTNEASKGGIPTPNSQSIPISPNFMEFNKFNNFKKMASLPQVKIF